MNKGARYRITEWVSFNFLYSFKIQVENYIFGFRVGRNDYLNEFKYFNPWISHTGFIKLT
jgi:hypothetical protein